MVLAIKKDYFEIILTHQSILQDAWKGAVYVIAINAAKAATKHKRAMVILQHWDLRVQQDGQ